MGIPEYRTAHRLKAHNRKKVMRRPVILFRNRERAQQFGENLFGSFSCSDGFGFQGEAVRQNRQAQLFYVLGYDKITPVKKCQGF